MGRWTPVPVAGGSYSDDAKPWTVQDTVNYLPVAAEREGTRSPAILRQRPGYTLFANTNASPVRGMHDAEGLRLVVAGTSLYSIHPTTGASTSLGTIPGVGRVSMAHNQIAGGVEVVIANGSSAYVWNTVTATLAQITDEGFPGAKVVDFCDGYIMFVEPFGRYWGHSDLADATSYNTLDRSEAEAQPDRIVTGAVSHREWVVFGERSTEFYRNTGGSTGTFQRITGTEAEIGAAGTHTVAKLDNTLFVVGSDGVGYRLNGYQFQRITTHAIEQAWSRCNLADAYCFTFEDHGHKVWYVSMTDGRTWGYDVATGEWHRCKSYGLDFWRMSHLIRWGGRWYGGDYTNGQIYLLDWRVNNDAGDPLERERTFAVMHDGGNRVFLDAILLEFDTGKTDASPALPIPVLSGLSISGDLLDGYQGDVETGSYSSAGGVLPHTFAVTAGTFPAGLALASDGSWSGTRTTTGTYNWTVTVTDSDGNTATLDDTSATYVAVSLISAQYRYKGQPDALTALTNGPTFDVQLFAARDGSAIAGKLSGSTALVIYRWTAATSTYDAQVITGATPVHDASEQWCAVSPDGSWVLALARVAGTVYAYEYDGAGYTLRNTFASGVANARGVCFNDDGDQFAVCFESTVTRTYSLAANGDIALLATSSGGSGSHRYLHWNGDYIVGSEPNSGAAVRVWTASTMVRAAEADNLTFGGVGSRAFINGTTVYAVGNDGANKAITFTLDAGAGTLTTVNTYALPASPTHAAFHPDGTYLFVGFGTGNDIYSIAGTVLTAETDAPNSGNISAFTGLI